RQTFHVVIWRKMHGPEGLHGACRRTFGEGCPTGEHSDASYQCPTNVSFHTAPPGIRFQICGRTTRLQIEGSKEAPRQGDAKRAQASGEKRQFRLKCTG